MKHGIILTNKYKIKLNNKTILTYPHPILLSKSQPVETIDQEIRDILDEMTNIIKINSGIGLAAPQIGISKRLITVCLNGKLHHVINPQISWQGGSQKTVEGCLSLPNQLFEVKRAQEVVIEGISPEEKEITLLIDGLLACVFQHEIDHLDGILINSIGTYVSSKKNKIKEDRV